MVSNAVPSIVCYAPTTCLQSGLTLSAGHCDNGSWKGRFWKTMILGGACKDLGKSGRLGYDSCLTFVAEAESIRKVS